jgi:hypothetical protein
MATNARGLSVAVVPCRARGERFFRCARARGFENTLPPSASGRRALVDDAIEEAREALGCPGRPERSAGSGHRGLRLL